MAGPYTPGNIELVRTNYNRDVHNIALMKMIMRDAVLTQSSNAGVERFYKESTTELDFNAQIPRDASFTSDQITLDDLDIRPQKHGQESRIAWEDTVVVGPNIVSRTSVRSANRVARSVNTRIYNTLTESQSASEIYSLAAAATWNNATRANRIPHEDVAEAVGIVNGSSNLSQLQVFQPDTLFINPFQYPFLRTNDYVMSSFDSSSPDLMRNGDMGQFIGLEVIVNSVVASDSCAVADAKKAVTWAEVQGLTTDVQQVPGKYFTFSSWIYGNAALLNGHAVCLITNTDA